ncbi:DUF2062 domain-containing protein [Bdellovibrio sp. HCB2-146]|uniref:DUF2062 domain-containing protein n=1 Tax=Bdellovibrio sp. HCB2-146 TaxID=3394362 RepID=UPI0039BC62E0
MLTKIKNFFIEQLKQGTSPEGIALACAVGATCAIFPFIGVTTTMCLIACYLLKLNHAVAQAVNYGMAAVQLILIPVFLKLGAWICRAPAVSVNPEKIVHEFWEAPQAFFISYGWALLQAMLAWLIVAPVFFFVIYKFTLMSLKTLNKVKRQA